LKVKVLIVLAALFAVVPAHASSPFGQILTDATACADALRAAGCDVNAANYSAIRKNVEACGAYRSTTGVTQGFAYLTNDGDLVLATTHGQGVKIGQGARVGGVYKNVCPATRYTSYLGQTFKFITLLDENKFFTITREGNVYYALPTQQFYALGENGAQYTSVTRIFSEGDEIRLEIRNTRTGELTYKGIDRGSLEARREAGIDSRVELKARTAESNSRASDSAFIRN
jgi:hypothetical protein